jgi:hypothetical protein
LDRQVRTKRVGGDPRPFFISLAAHLSFPVDDLEAGEIRRLFQSPINCGGWQGGKMSFYIRKPRQAIGLIYILVYILIFFTYAFIRRDDQSWTIESKFTVAVIVWFILSLAVKVSMVMHRTIELLNLIALLAFMAIGFTYNPQPDHFSSIENLCYYLNFLGGSACDLFDFVYTGAASRPEAPLAGSERQSRG